MPDEKMYLGIVYETTHIELGMVLPDGSIRYPRIMDVAGRNQQNTTRLLIKHIRTYLAEHGIQPIAIGVGLPGYTNPAKGIWMHCLRMGIRQPIHLASKLETAFGVPVFIDNDVNAATIAEQYYGIGRLCKNFIFVHVDEGVAMGVVAGGHLLRGAGNCVGELGHVTVEPEGELCECNARGCLENIVALDRILSKTYEKAPQFPNSQLKQVIGSHSLTINHIYNAAQEGDDLAMEITNRVIRALGTGLADSLNILNPEHIVLCGRVCGHEWFRSQVKKYVFSYGFVSSVATLRDITSSILRPEESGVLGAASLCFLREIGLEPI